MSQSRSYESGAVDGIAWSIAFTLQTQVHRAGSTLEERLNLFAFLLSDVLAQAEKKGCTAKEDADTLQELVQLLDGEPNYSKDQQGFKGLRRMYRICMDMNEHHYLERAELEIVLDQCNRDLKRIITKNNFANANVMNIVSAGPAHSPRLKEANNAG